MNWYTGNMQTHKTTFTIKEVAEYLGISRTTVNNLRKAGALKSFKIGRSVRILSSSLEVLTEQGFEL